MSARYLLSVVIPTRNRQQYAEASIRQVLAATSGEVEVIVQDNSDDPTLATELRELAGAERRLSYEHLPEELSFSANFDRAVLRSKGDYVCIIGDDDGVLPGLERVVGWSRAHRLHAITPALSAVYYWPGSMTGDRAFLNASLVAQPAHLAAKLADPKRAVQRLLAAGAVDYLTLPLVKTYHGVVSRALLDKVRGRTGQFFAGLSPDIYSSVSLSLSADRVLITGWPLTLPGVCATSGSADSAAGRHIGKLADAPHFRGNAGYAWSERVPPVYCVETIWADSALRAVVDMGITDANFNEAALRRIIRRRHSTLRDEVTGPKGPAGLRGELAVLARSGVRSGAAHARRLVRKPMTINHLADIASAALALSAAESDAEASSASMETCLDATLSAR